jgi:hypothetical protein
VTGPSPRRWDDYTASAPRSSPRWAESDRGWLLDGSRTALGFYLDYGPDYSRSPHEYCRPSACRCRLSQPGNILAVDCRTDDNRASHWVETIADAKAWLEYQLTPAEAL